MLKVSSSQRVQLGCVQSVHLGRGYHEEAREESWWSGRPGFKSQLRPSRLIGFGQVNSPLGTSVSSSVKEGSWLLQCCCEDSKKWCLQDAPCGLWDEAEHRYQCRSCLNLLAPRGLWIVSGAPCGHTYWSQMRWPRFLVPTLGCCWSYPCWGAGPFGHPATSFLFSWS